MGVRIDAAGHDEAALGVERAVAPQTLADRLDGLALDQHVGLIGAVRGDDRSAFDDERHSTLPNFCSRAQTCRRSAAADRYETISAFSSTACISTLAPAVAQSGLMSSLSLWLIPSTQGVNTIDVGATRAR